MSLRPFQYAEPESLEEVVSLLSENGSRVLAGGSDLLSEMKEGVVAPDVLVSLAGVEDLKGVEVASDGVRIGGHDLPGRLGSQQRASATLSRAC